MDVSLFHPSLLYRGRILKEDEESTATSQTVAGSNSNDRRRLANQPKPFFRVPFPTGAFWTNLVMLPQNGKASQKDENQFSYPIVAYPYSFQWSSLGKLQASYSAARRVAQAKTIQDEFAPDITLGSVEDINTRHVVQFDSLSVTLRFYSGDFKHSWETYIVQGSPYITAVYSGLSPELRALSDFNDISCPPTLQEGEVTAQQQPKYGEEPNQHRHRKLDLSASSSSASTATAGKKLGICDTAIDSSTQKKVITGVQFVVTTKEGLTWFVFTSEPVTFEFDQDAMRSIQSREKYTGVIRLALVPPTLLNAAASNSDGSSVTKSLDVGHLSSSSGVKRLIYHSGTYPVGGAVSWDFRSRKRSPLASFSSPDISANKAHGRRAIEQNVTRHRMTTDSPKDNNIGTITFSFDTNHMTASSPSTDVPLLMLALPHHAASISSAEALLLRPDDFDLTYHSIKGQMVPVVGNTWSYEEELTSIGFGNDPMPASSSSATGTSATSQHYSNHESTAISALDQSIRDLILNTVESDLKVNLPDLSSGAYSFGKQIARLAQLAHIAEVVDAANMIKIDTEVNRIKNETEIDLDQSPISSSMPPPLDKASSKSSSPDSRTTTTTTSTTTVTGATAMAFALLEKYVIMWLGGGGDERLVYDAQLGGILSKVGTEDINADFGNGRYNDHHFHCKSKKGCAYCTFW
jgi:endoglucanase Acf2